MRVVLSLLIVGLALCGTPFLGAQVSVFESTGGLTAGAPATVETLVLFDTFATAQGWSFGLCHDGTDLTLLDAVEGADTLTANQGGEPDFVAINPIPANGDGLTMGVVINFLGMDTLAPGMDLEILIVTYDVLMEDAGDLTTVSFCDTLGDPPVQTTIVLGDGTGEVPDFINGVWEIPTSCVPEFGDLTCLGGVTDASLTWEHPFCDFDDILIYRDTELLELLPGDTTSYTDPGLAPGSYTYTLVGVAFVGPFGDEPVSVIEECTVDIIPVTIDEIAPTSGYFLGGDLLTITGTGFMAAMDTTVTLDGVTCDDIQVIDDSMLTCLTPPRDSLGLVDVFVGNSLGSDMVVDGFLYGFIRGEINADGKVDIADPVVALDYLFVSGPEPICVDAVDANDDGVLDLADPIYLLTYLFALTPAPPPPFDEPGLDPTDDDPYGCLE